MPHGTDKRRLAASLFEKGASRASVARQLGIARSTSSAWHRRWRQGELVSEVRPGRRTQLDAEELQALGRALLDPPSAHGIGAETWSLRSVALLIERKTGIRYHHRHVARLVRKMGWLVPPFERYDHVARFVQSMDTPVGSMNLLVARHETPPKA